jgi:polysaccharide biosynthesis transport protein
MNSLIPITRELPVPQDTQFEPLEPGGVDLRLLLGVLLQRAALGIIVGAVICVLGVAFLMQMSPRYTAVGSLLVDPHRQNLASQRDQQNGMPPDMSAVDTQVEVLRSHALAEDVVKRLKLYNDPEFNGALAPRLFGPAKKPKDPPDVRTLAAVADGLQSVTLVRRAGLTYVVQVGATSQSPQKAAQIANALMETYIDRQLDEKVATITNANSVIGSRLEAMRREAEAAEARVQEYKNANGLFSTEGQTMAEQEVSTLNQQIASAKAETAEKQARLQAALDQVRRGSGGADIGVALGSDTIRELRTREAEVSTRLAQLKEDFKPEYPEVKRTQAQLNDIQGQIQSELNRILSSLRAEAAAAAEREGSLLGSRGQARGNLVSNNRAEVGLVALRQRAEASKQIYEAYLTRAKQVAAEGSLQQADATIASAASLPLRPSSPNKRVGLAVILFLAAAAGGASMLVAELWSRALRSRYDVENELGLPFAGVLPDLDSVLPKGRTRTASPADYLVQQPLSSFAEAFRNLGAFLRLGARSSPTKLIAITSAVPKEGKSMSSMCLARTLAMGGARVALVDCDLRLRGVTKIIGDVEWGLTEVVEGTRTLDAALVQDKPSGAWILPVAQRADIPHDLFSRPQVDVLFKALGEAFDYVILDTPPILGVADARILAAKAEKVLLLVRWNKTPVRAARSAVEILHECGADVMGALLSRVNVKAQARYGYGDSSDYFRYYRDYYITAR